MNNIKDFTNGCLYTERNAFNRLVPGEIMNPENTIFALNDCEESVVFDKRKYPVSPQALFGALNDGTINDFDKKILFIIATFSTVAVTTRIISELLVLMGDAPDGKIRETVDRSVKRLWKYGLVDSFKFQASDPEKFCGTRMFTITPNAFKLVKNYGLKNFYYDPIDIASRSVAENKRSCAAAQTVVSFIKHLPVQSFLFKKIIFNTSGKGKKSKVRPSAEMTVGTGENAEKMYVESVRRINNDGKTLLEKLARYNLIFSSMEGTCPTLIIVGEDEEHTRKLAEYLIANRALSDNLVFTNDLAVISDFHDAFYTYGDDGKRIKLYVA